MKLRLRKTYDVILLLSTSKWVHLQNLGVNVGAYSTSNPQKDKKCFQDLKISIYFIYFLGVTTQRPNVYQRDTHLLGEVAICWFFGGFRVGGTGAGGAITFNNTCIPRWCYAMARPCHLSLFMLGYFMLGSSSLGWRHPKRQPREINVAQTTFCHFEAWFQTSHRKSPGCAGLEFFEENEQTLLYPWQRSSCSKVWE